MEVKPKPFDYVNAINFKKNVPADTSGYVPFLTNRAMSYTMDTVLFANEMNRLPDADPDMQFAYLINIVRPRKRFAKWHKRVESDDVTTVADHFNISRRKAADYAEILGEQQIQKLRDMKGQDDDQRSGGDSSQE